MKSFFDGEAKNEALYDVLYCADGSYDVTLQDFDMKNLSDINIVKESILRNGWWKYVFSLLLKTKNMLSRLHKIYGQNIKQRKKVLYNG